MSDTLYDQDFVVWTERQGEALRRLAGEGSNLPLDWENLAEEIESVGRSQRSEVRSLVDQIVSHLLKRAYSPAERNYVKWESEIQLVRSRLAYMLEDSPSLRPSFPAMVEDALPRARRLAIRSLREYEEEDAITAVERTPLAVTAEQVLDQGWFLPGTRFGREASGDGQGR